MIGTTEQIQLAKLQKIIFNHVINDADCLGEILLKHCFIGEGRGCYSNFDLHPKFRLWPEGKDKFSENFIGHPDIYSPEEFAEEVEKINSYIDPVLDLAVAWDWSNGDGHLIFKFGNEILENTDIKKSYGWRFIS